jgi:bifunctional polynucleotide phosphatase/kinase
MKIIWDVQTNYMIGRTNQINLENSKIAAFDMDDTLIITPDIKKILEWQFYSPDIKERLEKYNDYNLVIITNQKGVSNKKLEIKVLQKKIEEIVSKLDLNFTICCAFDDDNYRKPRVGFWKLLNGNNESFFCGDAGGLLKRKINGKIIKKDFADTDLKFAENVGIKFMHRDEFIFGVKQDLKVEYPVKFENINMVNKYKFVPNTFELIINVGFPASGKSTFTLKNIVPNNYEYINQDTLGNIKKCLVLIEESLKKGKSVVVDNTNITVQSRKILIDLAKKYKVNCRCLIFNTDINICKHNNCYRGCVENNGVKIIPKIVYNMMKSKYVEPKIEEGLDKIDIVDFCLDPDTDLDLYKKYYF